MDFTWIITEGLSLRGNVGLLDASYDDFLTSSATGIVDKSSISLRRAPDMTAGLGMLFERQMAEGHWFVASVNYTWKDDYYISATANADHSVAGYVDNPSKVDAFGLLDASINWETENFTVSLFGKNLTDETYLMSFLDVRMWLRRGLTTLRQFMRPAAGPLVHQTGPVTSAQRFS